MNSDVSALLERLTAEVKPGRLREDQIDPEDHQPDEDAGAERADRKSRSRRPRCGLCGGGAGSSAMSASRSKTIARELESQLTTGPAISWRFDRADGRPSRGERMVDLSLNAIELIDRNLYERTCDVRWWRRFRRRRLSTAPAAAAVSHVSERLAVIPALYRVSRSLACDLEGNVLANGRADRFNVVGQNVR